MVCTINHRQVLPQYLLNTHTETYCDNSRLLFTPVIVHFAANDTVLFIVYEKISGTLVHAHVLLCCGSN